MENVQSLEPITISAVIDAPVEKVWELFTGPEHITQWCSASPDWHAPAATNDVRVGGKFNTVMAAKDGSMQFDFGGVYTDVTPNELIAYELGDGRKVKVTFEKYGGQVKVTEVFDPETTNPIEMQRGGWQAILDNFKKYTES